MRMAMVAVIMGAGQMRLSSLGVRQRRLQAGDIKIGVSVDQIAADAIGGRTKT